MTMRSPARTRCLISSGTRGIPLLKLKGTLTMFKTCLQCGKQFKTYQQAVNHCSRKCAIDAIRKKESRVCSYCGKTFLRQPARTRKGTTNVFCGRACHVEWRLRRTPQVFCALCGKSFFPKNRRRKYCSRKCHNESQVTATFIPCQHCGKSFRVFRSVVSKRRFCSRSCQEASMVGQGSPHWRGGTCRSHGRHWTRIRELVLQRDGICQHCGLTHSPSGRTLDIHHIDPRRNYSNQDDANIISNMVALCAPCHSRLEMAITHGHVQLLPTRLRVLALVP